MVTSTLEPTAFADVVVWSRRVGEGALTLPIRWRTLKPTSECDGSMDQVPVTRSVVLDLLSHEESP